MHTNIVCTIFGSLGLFIKKRV